MLDDQIYSIREDMRNAYQSIVSPEISYIRKETLDLERTADQDPWFPNSGNTDLLVEGIQLSQVTLIDDSTDIERVYKNLLSSETVGLTLMGAEISRRQKPDLIVLSTGNEFFAIDPNDHKIGLELVKKLLVEPEITVWTSNGIYEADCLYRHYNIKLEGSRAKCCTGLHVHMMQVLKSFPYNADKMLAMYPAKALEASRNRGLRLETYENMASIWLGAEPADLYCDSSKFIHLQTRPLDMTAINLIKKRCCLVTKIANEMMFYNKIELEAMNKNILYCLVTAENDLQRNAIRNEFKKCERKCVANIQYFAHLNGVFANPKSFQKRQQL